MSDVQETRAVFDLAIDEGSSDCGPRRECPVAFYPRGGQGARKPRDLSRRDDRSLLGSITDSISTKFHRLDFWKQAR